MSEKPKIKRSSKADQFDATNELWETKQLGASMEHAVSSSEEAEQALDEATGLQLLTFRMHKPIIEKLKQLAKLDDIGYQPLMRRVLTDYVMANAYKLERLLTAAEATEQADKFFAQALALRTQIPTLEPFSNERIIAEGDYNKALTEAYALFCAAYEKAEPVLKRHVQLRMSQINEILEQEFQDNKYGKRQAG